MQKQLLKDFYMCAKFTTRRMQTAYKFILAIIVTIFFFAPSVVYLYKFGNLSLSSDQGQWALLGDYIGGLTNPILTFATFLALLYTIKIQQDELKLTRNELSQTARSSAQQVEHLKREALKRDVYKLIEFKTSEINEFLKTQRFKPDLYINSAIEKFIPDLELPNELAQSLKTDNSREKS